MSLQHLSKFNSYYEKNFWIRLQIDNWVVVHKCPLKIGRNRMNTNPYFDKLQNLNLRYSLHTEWNDDSLHNWNVCEAIREYLLNCIIPNIMYCDE